MNIQILKINHSIATSAKVNLYVARADQIHPLASGNKYYKLKPNLAYAKENNIKCLLSFGGAFSNHIHALALTAEAEGFQSVGIIRGESAYAVNPTLSIAKQAGMKLEFVSREAYRKRNDPSYLKALEKRYPDCLIIPEGGSSQLAISGCKALAEEINLANNSAQFDYLLCASGTGATAAGLACGTEEDQRVIAYSVLRDESLGDRVAAFIKKETSDSKSLKIEQADFGGYAKFDKKLLDFVFDWYQQTGILLDPIYTSKLCMRLLEQLAAGEFKQGSNICIVHTGGLQGWLGMQRQALKVAGEPEWLQLEKLLLR